MKQINLNEWTKAGEGFEAESYNNNKDDSIMLKLYRKDILKSRIEASFYASIEYEKLNINTPKAYQIVECDGRMGVIYERIHDKISLYRMFVNDHNKASEIGRIFAKELRDLHKKTIDINKTKSRIEVLEYIVCGMLEKADFISAEKKENIVKNAKCFFGTFFDEANAENLCMGDCHIGNVVYANDKYYFIDLSDVQHGTPFIDLSCVISVYNNNDLINASFPENERIPIEYKKKFIDEFYNVYFEGKDKKYIDEQMKKINKYAVIQELLLHIYVSKSEKEIERILC